MPLELVAHGTSDVGKKRKVNEDSYAVDQERGFFIVCDGMGGHGNGATASSSAVGMVREYLNGSIAIFERYAAAPSDANRAASVKAIEDAIQTACGRIFAVGQQDSTKRGMGTTIDVVVRTGNQILLGHVGDGRVYLVRSGQSYRLTEDHTIVQQQIKAGILTPEEAEESTMKGVLTRALGTHQSVQVDTLVLDLADGDLLMMCSDGLHRYVKDEEVALRVREAGPGAPRALIDFANQSGGADNICAIVMGARNVGAPNQESAKVESRFDAVRNLPLFQYLSYKEQVKVLSIAHSRLYEPGAVIVRQGDSGQEMFLIVDGSVEVDAGGVKLADLGAGGHFGEMSLVDDAPRSATVRAKQRTDVLVISQSDVGGLMRMDPVLAVKILWSFVQVLSGRLRVASADLSHFKLDSPERASAVPYPFAK